MNSKTALIIVIDGTEELEAIAPVDCLRRAGVEVTLASAGGDSITGRNGIKIIADTELNACIDKTYDLVIIPGGPGHKDMADDDRIITILQKQNAANRLIGSICAGPVVLNKAGVLEGKAFTSFPATRDILPQRDPLSKIVRDGNLITSQGAGTAIEFALALVESLCGSDVRREVARSTCFEA